MRSPAFSFSSAAMLGSSFPNNAPVPFPLEDDPNIWLWFSADQHVTIDAVGSPRIYTLGNKSTRQVSKTDRTTSGCTNLVPGLGYSPFTSRTDNAGNLVIGTDVGMTAAGDWSYSNCTRNSSSLITFTAQNGQARYGADNYITGGSLSCKLSVQLRRISGNSNLELLTDTTYTPITITDSPATYTVEFTSSSSMGGYLYLGVRDPNAAGHGQVECLYWSLRLSTWDNTYIETNSYGPILPGWLGRKVLYFPRKFLSHNNIGANAFGSPATVYFTIWPKWVYPVRVLCLGGPVYNWFFSMENNNPGQYSMYTNSGAKRILTPAAWMPDNTWSVVTLTMQSGGTSTMRRNLGAVTSGDLGTITNSGFDYWGGNKDDSFFSTSIQYTELIWRNKIDDAATQEAYVRYLANKVGISL